MFRFLRAVIRNCGVALAISIFFAAARGPTHPQPSGMVEALAAAAASYLGPVFPRQRDAECERPPGRDCRLVDVGQPTLASAP